MDEILEFARVCRKVPLERLLSGNDEREAMSVQMSRLQIRDDASYGTGIVPQSRRGKREGS